MRNLRGCFIFCEGVGVIERIIYRHGHVSNHACVFRWIKFRVDGQCSVIICSKIYVPIAGSSAIVSSYQCCVRKIA